MGKEYVTNVAKKNAHRILVGKIEEQTSLKKPKRRRVDNIKMDLGEIGWGGGEWIDLAQGMDR
jgi:hypothetical protein